MTEPAAFTLRPALSSDCRRYWELRNELSAREASISSEPIPFEKHQVWFARKLEDSACRLLIVEDAAGASVGYVRFDLAGVEAEISICIDAAARGKGYASAAIERASRELVASGPIWRIKAHIKESNAGSIRAFERAGYRFSCHESTPNGLTRWMDYCRSERRPVAILQARMGSTRLPGKCLLEVGGRSLLEHCIRGVRRSQLVGRIVVATSDLPEDDAIEAASTRLGIDVFRGSAKDVLARYHGALERFPGEPVIRLTGDCPLMDGRVIDKAIRTFLEQRVDYLSTGASKSYPRGLDVEVFTAAALRRAFAEGRNEYHREHVTPYLYEEPGRFRMASSGHDEDLSSWRLTVDTAEDLAVVKAVIEGLESAGESVEFETVVAFIKRHPDLLELNSGVRQKSYLEVG